MTVLKAWRVCYCNVKELIVPWRTFPHCACCQGCVHLAGVTCRLHGRTKRLCNGACPDRLPKEPDLSVLTDEERARCAQLTRHPAARFPLLTLDEMRRLLWYQEYFGHREHERPTRRFPRLSPHDYRAIRRFLRPDAA